MLVSVDQALRLFANSQGTFVRINWDNTWERSRVSLVWGPDRKLRRKEITGEGAG